MIMLDRRETTSDFCPGVNGVVCGCVSVKSDNGGRPVVVPVAALGCAGAPADGE